MALYLLQITVHVRQMAPATAFTTPGIATHTWLNATMANWGPNAWWLLREEEGNRYYTTLSHHQEEGKRKLTYTGVFGINYNGRCVIDRRSTLKVLKTYMCEFMQLWTRPSKPRVRRCLWNTQIDIQRYSCSSLTEGPSGRLLQRCLGNGLAWVKHGYHEHTDLLFFGGAWSSGVGPGLWWKA